MKKLAFLSLVLAFGFSDIDWAAGQACSTECVAGHAFYKDREQDTLAITVDEETSDGGTICSALDKNVLWPPGSTLDIVFIEAFPSEAIRRQIHRHIAEWEDVSNLRMNIFDTRADFQNKGDGSAEITVSFSKEGHYSQVGLTSAQNQNPESMNLEFDANESEDEVRRVTLHEFGHALGFKHEHQNPNGPIQWKQPEAMNYYRASTGWDAGKIQRNIFDALDQASTIGSTFDKDSIMCYRIPASITIDGREIGNNTYLSDTDKKWVQIAYPYTYLAKLGITVRTRKAGDGSPGVVIESLPPGHRCRNLSNGNGQLFNLEVGDRIVSINNQRVENVDEATWGDDNIQNQFRIVVENVQDGNILTLFSNGGAVPQVPQPVLGLNGNATQDGFLITGVTAHMPGFHSGLENGDVIVSIAGTNVRSAQDVSRKLLELARQGVHHADFDVLNVRLSHLPKAQRHTTVHVHF